ncbi:pyridoxamine 5'-phosphate oxidase family protein [Amycolatopsis cihanbeyliensis]|uniref:General stress protein 26 n=1 Tax=Amycolatopsis cihanbeyliensis TaxID=1128664 RepID=A0A542DIJ3_AMYCI|nr:pyridoxamine 5'-phosphate oxidase family protein [Amycolatopsis cihanbeyliensis]TQJ02805.1 general stress protein 26 [Amycolatopsis cihanbeyliensis]
MTTTMTRTQREEFLADTRIAVLSVASDDHRPPLTVPVFYGYQPGGEITFFTGTEGRRARKTRLIERAKVLSICVQREEPPFQYVTVEGTLAGIERPPSAEQLRNVIRRYVPEDVARQWVEEEIGNPAGTLVLFRVRPDRWLSMDAGEDMK